MMMVSNAGNMEPLRYGGYILAGAGRILNYAVRTVHVPLAAQGVMTCSVGILGVLGCLGQDSGLYAQAASIAALASSVLTMCYAYQQYFAAESDLSDLSESIRLAARAETVKASLRFVSGLLFIAGQAVSVYQVGRILHLTLLSASGLASVVASVAGAVFGDL
ncbi:MAG: hypothetical protein KDK78_08475 [Chlamydiia bacterium]|nr:hypothetical protein [Chlamydiia bacterium]